MTLAMDMDAPLTELMRTAALLAERPDLRERIIACVAALEDVQQRVCTLEHNPVPKHWLGQRPVGEADAQAGVVVSLMDARLRRLGARPLTVERPPCSPAS